MTLSLKLETDVLEAEIRSFVSSLTNVHMVDAVRRGAAEQARVYRDILQRYYKDPPGNSSFEFAYKAITVKVGAFRDRTGAWSVVGPSVVNGRMPAPQQQFGEAGTARRTTKSGADRGAMPAYHWLAMANEQSKDLARIAILKRLIKLVN